MSTKILYVAVHSGLGKAYFIQATAPKTYEKIDCYEVEGGLRGSVTTIENSLGIARKFVDDFHLASLDEVREGTAINVGLCSIFEFKSDSLVISNAIKKWEEIYSPKVHLEHRFDDGLVTNNQVDNNSSSEEESRSYS